MLISEAAGLRPTAKKNRRLVFAVASGCTLVELFSTRPPFLVGRVTWKRFILLSYFLLFLSLYILLDVPTWLFCITNVIEYSVKLPFSQDKYFFSF